MASKDAELLEVAARATGAEQRCKALETAAAAHRAELQAAVTAEKAGARQLAVVTQERDALRRALAGAKCRAVALTAIVISQQNHCLCYPSLPAAQVPAPAAQPSKPAPCPCPVQCRPPSLTPKPSVTSCKWSSRRRAVSSCRRW